MNLGDGLLFELDNGKPRLIVLNHGLEKNLAKQLSCRPSAANILSCRQPSCAEDVQVERVSRQQTGRHRDVRVKAGVSHKAAHEERMTNITPFTAQQHHTASKVKSDKSKHSLTTGSHRAKGKTGSCQSSWTQGGSNVGLMDTLVSGDVGLKDNIVCLTKEELQKIIDAVQLSSNGRQPAEDLRTQCREGHHAVSKSVSSINEGGVEEMTEDRQEGCDSTGSSQDKDTRSIGCLFSWMEERESESRAALEAKKAQWRRELNEQVALKQQPRKRYSNPIRLQAERDTDIMLPVQSSFSHREQPAAIRSSLKLGEITPIEDGQTIERRAEERRRWLEELNRQREETTERRRREKALQSQTEDHELWAAHFDSLQHRPPVQPAAPPAGSERGDWEPSSSLSQLWDATSSCGAESVRGASVDVTSRHSTRASYSRTMTALLDPVQIEEREKRRLKQLEQQRAIEAQMEERRQQREQEEKRKRAEEEEEERRLVQEREKLQRQYEHDTMRERQKELEKHTDDGKLQETLESSASRPAKGSKEMASASVFKYKDTAVQTEAAPPLISERHQTPEVSAPFQPPQSLTAAPPNSRSRVMRTGKENICLSGAGVGKDPYEAFARAERSTKDKRRPEWNTQRPSRRFVPASERYPAEQLRSRQESRLKRQAELLALQERTCLSVADPPPPPLPHQEPHPRYIPSRTRTSPRKVESLSNGPHLSEAGSSERRSLRSQQVSTSPPHPSALEFIPFVRTDEVFHLDPLEPADTPPLPAHLGAPPQRSTSRTSSHPDPHRHILLLRDTHTARQQEILRGLAQLRQGLLQKQKEWKLI